MACDIQIRKATNVLFDEPCKVAEGASDIWRTSLYVRDANGDEYEIDIFGKTEEAVTLAPYKVSEDED